MTSPEPMPEASHTGWSAQETAVLDAMDVPRNRAARMMLFEAYKRTGLSPFSKQLYVALRNGWWKVETSIHGMRSVAAQEESYDGQVGPHWCGTDGEWKDVWTSKEPPVAARVGIRVKGREEPTWGVCHFEEFVVRKLDGSDDAFWVKMPRNQIAKCSESQALRKEFSHKLGGIYTADEMGSDDPGGAVQAETGVWDEREEITFERSAALIEDAALEKDMTDLQRELAEALARMNSTVAEPDPATRYEGLRAMWMKTGQALRQTRTPQGPLFKELIMQHLGQAKEELDGKKPEPESPEATRTTEASPADQVVPEDAPSPEPEPAPQEDAAEASEQPEEEPAPAPQPPRPARRRRAASSARTAPSTPEQPETPEAPEAVEAPVVSATGNDGERLKLKCGCDRETVLVQGDHQKGCKRGRKQ